MSDDSQWWENFAYLGWGVAAVLFIHLMYELTHVNPSCY